jgi:4-hydroxy-tetrahydrodipicolinate synthase
MLVTALVTPFASDGTVDLAALQSLVEWQLGQGVARVLLFGTTGEGAALMEVERERALEAAAQVAAPEQLMVGLGFGPLPLVVERGRASLARGVRALLLVDAPYAGPSSAALREHWHGAVASALPEARLYPYAVPSRTQTELLPDDLARLVEDHPNVVGVKDATGRLARFERVRELLGDEFELLCGDDVHLRDTLIDPMIRAHGGFSVTSNLAPARCAELVAAGRAGDAAGARRLHDRLAPLFGLVSVTAEERMELGGVSVAVPQRAKNPVPLKTALQLLGAPGGASRPPLAPLGPNGRAGRPRPTGWPRGRDANLLAPLREAFGLSGPEVLAPSLQAPREELLGRLS